MAYPSSSRELVAGASSFLRRVLVACRGGRPFGSGEREAGEGQRGEAGGESGAHVVVCGTCGLVHYSAAGKVGSPQHIHCEGKNKHRTSYVRGLGTKFGCTGCNCKPAGITQDAEPKVFCPHVGV